MRRWQAWPSLQACVAMLATRSSGAASDGGPLWPHQRQRLTALTVDFLILSDIVGYNLVVQGIARHCLARHCSARHGRARQG